ncbi:hypothetical protein EYF80_024525 [Liparis tanakae]|uniref:Uncharacterized protein n=1 Tax=Liparis tanakae TaxID=230148 RepID=A0A4Z2HHJ3_9TELE|nr:hypothetical protein EYF80_024525 [Liparis tanakae]
MWLGLLCSSPDFLPRRGLCLPGEPLASASFPSCFFCCSRLLSFILCRSSLLTEPSLELLLFSFGTASAFNPPLGRPRGVAVYPRYFGLGRRVWRARFGLAGRWWRLPVALRLRCWSAISVLATAIVLLGLLGEASDAGVERRGGGFRATGGAFAVRRLEEGLLAALWFRHAGVLQGGVLPCIVLIGDGFWLLRCRITNLFIYSAGDSPSWGKQYTGPSSLLSKEEKDSWDDQEEGDGCSAADEGGSMKLQLKRSPLLTLLSQDSCGFCGFVVSEMTLLLFL